MDISQLTIGQAKEIAALLGALVGGAPASGNTSPHVGKFVLVRTYSAGVHFGVLKSQNGIQVELGEAQRLWYWEKANTLNEVSTKGVGGASKVSEPVPTITLTQAVEVLPCSDEAQKLLRGQKWGK